MKNIKSKKSILPQENQEHCKCPQPISERDKCMDCGKLLPEKQDKEIEELDKDDDWRCYDLHIELLKDKINELIRIVNQRK